MVAAGPATPTDGVRSPQKGQPSLFDSKQRCLGPFCVGRSRQRRFSKRRDVPRSSGLIEVPSNKIVDYPFSAPPILIFWVGIFWGTHSWGRPPPRRWGAGAHRSCRARMKTARRAWCAELPKTRSGIAHVTPIRRSTGCAPAIVCSVAPSCVATTKLINSAGIRAGIATSRTPAGRLGSRRQRPRRRSAPGTDAAGVPIPHYYMLAWRYGQHAIVHRRLGRETLTPFGEQRRHVSLGMEPEQARIAAAALRRRIAIEHDDDGPNEFGEEEEEAEDEEGF